MKHEPIEILVVEPHKQPYTKVIDGSLESMQSIVQGSIEMVYPYDDNIAIVCNDEGKLNGLPNNRLLRDAEGVPYDIICGTFFIVGLGEEDCISLTENQIERYGKEFSIRMNPHRSHPYHEER